MKYLWGAVICACALTPISCTVPVKPLLELAPKPARISAAPDAASQKLSDDAYKLIGRKQWKAALAPARKAVQLAPKWGEAHKNLALALLHTGALKEAQVHAQAATRLSPDFAKGHDVLGQVLTARKQPTAALKALKNAVKLDSRYARAYYDAGLAYRELHRQVKGEAAAEKALLGAQSMFAKAVALDANDAVYHREWADTLVWLSANRDAEREYRIVIEKEPHDEHAYNELLELLRSDGRNEEYRQLALEALPQVQPRSALVLYHLGHSSAELSNGQRDGEAVRYFKESLSIDPKIGRTYDGMGLVLGRNGREVEALQYFQKAVQLMPDFALAHLHLGTALYANGNHAAGRAEWRKAQAMGKKQGEINSQSLAAEYLVTYSE